MCERDYLFGVRFGTMINDKVEDLRQNLWRKSVGRSATVQEGCYVYDRGLQHLV